MTKLKIPDFKSLEDASDFWDTHSFADYLEDTEPVEIEVRFARRRILLEIDSDLSEKLRKIAQKKGQSYSKLINSWIREKIMQEASNWAADWTNLNPERWINWLNGLRWAAKCTIFLSGKHAAHDEAESAGWHAPMQFLMLPKSTRCIPRAWRQGREWGQHWAWERGAGGGEEGEVHGAGGEIAALGLRGIRGCLLYFIEYFKNK